MTSLAFETPSNSSSSASDLPIRSSKHSPAFLFNPKHYLRNLRSTSTDVVDAKDLSEDTQALLHSICSKFTFTE